MPIKLPNRNTEQLLIRLPLEMRETLKRLAVENGRTVNAQVLALIEKGLHDEMPKKQESTASLRQFIDDGNRQLLREIRALSRKISNSDGE